MKLDCSEEPLSLKAKDGYPRVIRNWSSVRKAFEARNRLVHGRDRYTLHMAAPHVENLLQGASYVDDYCATLGSPLFGRMPIRRKQQ